MSVHFKRIQKTTRLYNEKNYLYSAVCLQQARVQLETHFNKQN